ncbi:serine hydrolase domain-containing protein [Pedobacter antarcticus]|uniref:Beta-lactamase n=2 Tax=Pedobacter antarcticus TaxID=34086 RepID=A0A081PF02_9SPHI|nr:serine hydrolase domain-containing protein [Pedobacter antarcticus]KEQ29275.1 beta-lactamase [Pedobacter antarcticus 4BY]SDL94287.1 CubicO group peptidase, beta-lactamase class C family [Pedobacter antarcticus]SFE75838.1 CubicO group peptidase, beta-lactamase class C family [Pedobacter antarcticus]
MTYRIITFAALLAVSTFSACSNSEKKIADPKIRTVSDDKKDSLLLVYNPEKGDKWIADFAQNLHKKYGFNGNMLVAKDGKILYEKSLGWADYLHRDSLKINSEFELASITKTFTGVAIMQLIEAGKIHLTDDVKKFFPNFPYEGVTVRLLLTHRSGMMNYVYFSDGVWKDKKKPMSNMDVMNLIAEYKPNRYAKPDTRFHYNNSNYMVLASIIEKVTGKPYSDYMMDHVFKPAGMKNTHVYSTTVYPKIPVDVVGHDRTWKYSVVQNFLDGPVGDKGIYSTVHDLVLYDNALRTGRLLTQASLDSAYTGHNKPVNGHFNYGYGWRMFDGNKGRKVVYHTGWWHGFRHIYVRDLDKNIVIVFLGNLTNGSLLHLDELYKHLGVPVIRKGAYSGSGSLPGSDED